MINFPERTRARRGFPGETRHCIFYIRVNSSRGQLNFWRISLCLSFIRLPLMRCLRGAAVVVPIPSGIFDDVNFGCNCGRKREWLSGVIVLSQRVPWFRARSSHAWRKSKNEILLTRWHVYYAQLILERKARWISNVIRLQSVKRGLKTEHGTLQHHLSLNSINIQVYSKYEVSINVVQFRISQLWQLYRCY